VKFGIDDNEEGVGNRDDKFSAERINKKQKWQHIIRNIE